MVDGEKLLIAHGKEGILRHSRAVAERILPMADAFGLPQETCRRAALSHDVGGILSPDAMLKEAIESGMALDPAEDRHPFLLHQRFSRRILKAMGEKDEALLSAVGCHTTLKAGASPLDMALFLADKLAWDQQGPPPYGPLVIREMAISLERACLAYMDYALGHGMILTPHRWLLEARTWLVPYSMIS